MIGINDISVISNEKILKNYEAIVQQIKTKSPSTQLFLQSILPVNNQVRNSGKSNQDVIFLNKKIQQIAAKNGVVYVNLYPHFLDDRGNLDAAFTQDGIHLDAKGYLIWKAQLKKYLS
ncbi:MAG: GDSL-type esterase/lipase family protein [Bacteroidota bacterium]